MHDPLQVLNATGWRRVLFLRAEISSTTNPEKCITHRPLHSGNFSKAEQQSSILTHWSTTESSIFRPVVMPPMIWLIRHSVWMRWWKRKWKMERCKKLRRHQHWKTPACWVHMFKEAFVKLHVSWRGHDWRGHEEDMMSVLMMFWLSPHF